MFRWFCSSDIYSFSINSKSGKFSVFLLKIAKNRADTERFSLQKSFNFDHGINIKKSRKGLTIDFTKMENNFF
jgi:hypothetical protein